MPDKIGSMHVLLAASLKMKGKSLHEHYRVPLHIIIVYYAKVIMANHKLKTSSMHTQISDAHSSNRPVDQV